MNRTTELNEMKKRLSEIVDKHERLRNSYFFTPNSCASGRRSAEKKNNDCYANNRYKIYACNDYSESCKNVYYRGIFEVDGKHTTVKTIKNIIEALDYIC